MKKKFLFVLSSLLLFQLASAQESTVKVLKVEDVNWEALNPARGDISPCAGTLWGNRKGEVATGFLANFKDGFSSPPHIHNVTYRALVISGNIHNDSPEAKEVWMKPGSFWTQVAGEAHITSAQGEQNIAYVEIDNGPYLVKPTDKAFDEGKQSMNVAYDNLVWLTAEESERIQSSSTASIAYLWDNGKESAYLIRLPKGDKGILKNENAYLRAVLIAGTIQYTNNKTSDTLKTASFFSSNVAGKHEIRSSNEEQTLLYIRTDGNFQLE